MEQRTFEPPRVSRTTAAMTLLLLLAAPGFSAPAAQQPSTSSNSPFDVQFDRGAIVSLRRRNDAFETQYVLPGRRLGDVVLCYRKPKGEWQQAATVDLSKTGEVSCSASADGSQYDATYRIAAGGSFDLLLRVHYVFQDHAILWTLTLQNQTDQPLEVGDLAVPFPMNSVYRWDKPPTASVLKHSFVSGDNSYLFWMRCNSVGPYLTAIPLANTSLEYWDRQNGYRVYLHSAAAGAVAKAKGCNWRQPHTSQKLGPRGTSSDARTYGFKFQWAADYEGVRRMLVDAGKIDVHVMPGMTVPTDLSARIALRTKAKIHAVEAEFPDATQIEPLGAGPDQFSLYQVRFARLGENRITIRYGDGRRTFLEFFCTEPIETLIKKRAAFIARCQHRNPAKWYNGLISEWNMESKVLLGPDNYDRIKGWRIYEVSCDDPGLCKPAFLAAKNGEYPVQGEVEALDYYIRHFVWGGLQRTTDESFAYGIYGIPDWKTNRQSSDPGPKGKLHLWRIYDYPHLVVMYFSMYRIAKQHPHIKTELTAEEYLRRACGTALALFTVPSEIQKWSAYGTGLYNEVVIPELIEELRAAGWNAEADRLREHWERKARFFLNDKPNVFASEYPFDSTGFESTHALARYAVQHADAPGSKRKTGIALDRAKEFLKTQMAANLFCRGWLEPAYYLLGSDYRARGGDGYTLSYMSQMGGWAVLDYGLHFAEDPSPYLRLGYASYLSSWALMNTGTPESNYGYWYPGKENDGGAGGGFEPAPYGSTWLEQPHHRGSWYYSCEIDLGYCGALRTAATVLADDPIFGRVCLGGDWTTTEGRIQVVPKDGLRRRFHAMSGDRRLHLLLEGARFLAAKPIALKEDHTEVRFQLESDCPKRHRAQLRISGLEPGDYILREGQSQRLMFSVQAGRDQTLELFVDPAAPTRRFVIEKQATINRR